jgi:hypothetical protein
MERNHFAETKFRRGTLIHFAEVFREGTSGWNSLWRIHEVARTMGYSEAVRRLSVG